MIAVPSVDERLTWVGHATVLLEIGGARLLTDPLLRTRLGHLRRHGAPPAPEVTQDIDAVLVSHVHLDHLDVRSLRSVARTARVIAPGGAGTSTNTIEGVETLSSARHRIIPHRNETRTNAMAVAITDGNLQPEAGVGSREFFACGHARL